MLSIPEIQKIYSFHSSLFEHGTQNEQLQRIYNSDIQDSRLAKITSILYEIDHDVAYISERPEFKRLRIISYEEEIKLACIEYFYATDQVKSADLELKLNALVDGYKIWMFDTTFLRDTDFVQHGNIQEYIERINDNNHEFYAIFDVLAHDLEHAGLF